MLLPGASMKSRQSKPLDSNDLNKSNANLAVVFSIVDLPSLCDSYEDIRIEGKLSLVSTSKHCYGKASPPEAYDAVSFVNCFDVVKDCKSTPNTPNHWKSKIDEAINDINEFLLFMNGQYTGGTVYVDIAAYEPLEGLGYALCYALQKSIPPEEQPYYSEFEQFIEFSKNHYANVFYYMTEGSGWNIEVPYIAAIELYGVYTPTKEERTKLELDIAYERQQEAERLYWEAEEERIRIKQEEYNESKKIRHMVIGGAAIVGLALVVIGTVFFPPVGAAVFLGAAGTGGLTVAGAGSALVTAAGVTGAIVHMGELAYEAYDEELTVEVKEHIVGALVDALLCLKWEKLIGLFVKSEEYALKGGRELLKFLGSDGKVINEAAEVAEVAKPVAEVAKPAAEVANVTAQSSKATTASTYTVASSGGKTFQYTSESFLSSDVAAMQQGGRTMLTTEAGSVASQGAKVTEQTASVATQGTKATEQVASVATQGTNATEQVASVASQGAKATEQAASQTSQAGWKGWTETQRRAADQAYEQSLRKSLAEGGTEYGPTQQMLDAANQAANDAAARVGANASSQTASQGAGRVASSSVSSSTSSAAASSAHVTPPKPVYLSNPYAPQSTVGKIWDSAPSELVRNAYSTNSSAESVYDGWEVLTDGDDDQKDPPKDKK